MPATISSLRTQPSGSGGKHSGSRPSGWSVHPSNAASSADGVRPVLPFESLQSIAAGLALTQRAVPEDDANTATARSTRLIATSLYDVWLITWPAGSTLGSHDHGGARSVLHVVEGELVETFTDQPTGAPHVRVLRSGDVACGGTSFCHGVANRSGADATSLHVYSPPLSDLTFSGSFADGESAQDRTIPVHEQSPQASSKDAKGVNFRR
jgi:uncharacterized RmlC-like cupin family protein